MRLFRQRPQPIDNRAGAAVGPGRKLAADADVEEQLLHRRGFRGHRTGRAEQAGANHGHAGRRQPVGKINHQRVQRRNFVDDDHGRTATAPVNGPRVRAGGEIAEAVVGQWHGCFHLGAECVGGSVLARCGRDGPGRPCASSGVCASHSHQAVLRLGGSFGT